MTRDRRRLLEDRASARCEQLGGFYRANEEFSGNGEVLSYLNRRRKNHETYNNGNGNCTRADKLGRDGANERNGWIRNSHGSFSGLVHRFSGHDECTAHVEEHWSGSASAQHSHFCADPDPSSRDADVRGAPVKKKRPSHLREDLLPKQSSEIHDGKVKLFRELRVHEGRDLRHRRNRRTNVGSAAVNSIPRTLRISN
jgi:hypothetical protein